MSLNLGIISSSYKAAAPSGNLLLDDYPNASTAYSVRKLRSAYTGFCIRVRRSSDNTFANIGFVNNVLDTGSLLSFCGSSSGFIQTWYDQSGNANNAVQSTTTSQPTIVLNGVIYLQNGLPTMFFLGISGANDLRFTGIVADTNVSTFLVGKALSATVSGPMIAHFEEIPGMIVGQYNNRNYLIITKLNGTSLYSETAANSLDLNFCIQNVYVTTNISAYKNNTLIPITTQFAFAAVNLNFNSIGKYGNFIATHGYISEAIIYKTNQLTNRTGINANINSFYTIF